MTKINVTFADENASSVIVHTSLAYEIQPVSDFKLSDKV
jgi:hypothetical protein